MPVAVWPQQVAASAGSPFRKTHSGDHPTPSPPTPSARLAGVRKTSPRTQTCTFQGSQRFKHQIPRVKKENCGGRGKKKKARIVGPPSSPLRSPDRRTPPGRTRWPNLVWPKLVTPPKQKELARFQDEVSQLRTQLASRPNAPPLPQAPPPVPASVGGYSPLLPPSFHQLGSVKPRCDVHRSEVRQGRQCHMHGCHTVVSRFCASGFYTLRCTLHRSRHGLFVAGASFEPFKANLSLFEPLGWSTNNVVTLILNPFCGHHTSISAPTKNQSDVGCGHHWG